MKNFKPWLITAIVLQLATGLIHSISLFVPMRATDESEETLVRLFTTQQLDLGSGFHRTLYEIFLSVSLCLTLLYIFGGLLNWYFLRKKLAPDLMRGMIGIQVLIFGICFFGIVRYAFLPPIVLTGLSFLFLLMTWITMPRPSTDRSRS